MPHIGRRSRSGQNQISARSSYTGAAKPERTEPNFSEEFLYWGGKAGADRTKFQRGVLIGAAKESPQSRALPGPIGRAVVISVELHLNVTGERSLRMKLGGMTDTLAPQTNVNIRLRPTDPVDPFCRE